MARMIDLLEKRRAELKIPQVTLVERLKLPKCSDPSLYSRIKSGKRRMPASWHAPVAKFLGISLEDLKVSENEERELRPAEQFSTRKFSGEELRTFASIADGVGHPLTLETLLRIAAEIKTAASP